MTATTVSATIVDDMAIITAARQAMRMAALNYPKYGVVSYNNACVRG